MDLALTTGAAITRTVNGTEYRFPRLTMGELGDMLESLRSKRRAQLVARLDECKITGSERFAKLTEFDDRDFSLGTGIVWTFTPEGLGRTLRASMAKNPAGPQADDVLPFSPFDLQTIAAELWGERPRISNPDDATAQDEPAEVGHDPLTQTGETPPALAA